MAESIQIEDESIIIDDFEINDSEVKAFLDDTKDERKEEKIRKALRMGVLALKSSQDAQNIDYVEKRFNSMKNEFENKINDLLGEDGELINGLDPNEDGSPLKQLKSEIDEKFSELHDEILEEEVAQEMAEKTSLKGDKFEETLHEVLSPIVSTTGDNLRFTGEESGELGDSKVGDFVIELANQNENVVIEAKNASNYTQPKIEDELEEAIENRAAEYSIFVAKSTEQLPNKIGCFNEYNQNQLVIVASDDGENVSRDYLEIAVKWARMRVAQRKGSLGDDVDAEEAKSNIESAERTLKSFSQIKSNCTSIEKETEKIKGRADEMKRELEDSLDNISEAIS
jgi:hypothetical protein